MSGRVPYLRKLTGSESMSGRTEVYMSTPDRLVVAPHLRSSINFLSCRRVAISVDLFDASLSRRRGGCLSLERNKQRTGHRPLH